jgi:hypothetical protein
MKTAYSLGLAVLLNFAGAVTAQAAQYYVRTDGSDSCTGLGNTGGSSGTCAFKTIAKCETVARCGDTCNVGAGDYFLSASVSLSDSCTASNPKRIVGVGYDQVRVWSGMVGPLTCSSTPKSGTTSVYECDVPSGAATNSASFSNKACFVQMLGTNSVNLEPELGRKQSIRRSICLTPASSASASVIDSDDNDLGDSTLGSASGEGFWFHATGDAKYQIHPWNNLAPSSSIKFYAPINTYDFSPFELSGKFVEVKGLTVTLAGGARLRLGGLTTSEGGKFVDIRAYHGGVQVGGGADTRHGTNLGVENVGVYNLLRRATNKGCGKLGNPCSTTADFPNTPNGCSITGSGTKVDGLECYSGVEAGGGFGGQGLDVRRMTVHGFINHGCKADGPLIDSNFENLLCYNNQEGFFSANCSKNVTFRHVTIGGTWIYNGHYAEPCWDGSRGWWNVDIYNSAIEKFSHTNHYNHCTPSYNRTCSLSGCSEGQQCNCDSGDVCVKVDWRAGDRDLDWSNNVYYGADTIVAHMKSGSSFDSVASWQAWSSDPCTNCSRDANSVEGSITTVFVKPSKSDLDSDLSDWNLKSGSPAINRGTDSQAPRGGKDIRGVVRTMPPDAGAYEFGSAGTQTCGNGVAEGTEQCDGSNLNGATCELLGLGPGILLCSSTCTFNTSDCTGNVPPPAPTGVRRDDVLP